MFGPDYRPLWTLMLIGAVAVVLTVAFLPAAILVAFAAFGLSAPAWVFWLASAWIVIILALVAWLVFEFARW